jgi:Skp family chaperone for outer membrane proteins
MEKQLETELDNAIKAEASSKQLNSVLDKSAVLLGGTDITDGVAKRLASSPTVTGNAESATK